MAEEPGGGPIRELGQEMQPRKSGAGGEPDRANGVSTLNKLQSKLPTLLKSWNLKKAVIQYFAILLSKLNTGSRKLDGFLIRELLTLAKSD